MGLSKLPMSKLPALKVLAVLALAVSMSACSMFKAKHDTIDKMPVDALYNNAHASMENADYAAASKAYQRLIARFPSGDVQRAGAARSGLLAVQGQQAG